MPIRPSSDRLLTVAEHFCPGTKAGSTQFRNLMSYYLARQTSYNVDTLPLSFWIDEVEWYADEVVSLVNHLNFYLSYYDAISPYILIHNTRDPQPFARPQIRFPFGSFPEHIEGRELDDALLILWDAARKGDTARRFLYCYRIIEYASFFYLEGKARTEIRRILSTPHSLSDVNEITAQVMDALNKSRQEDYQRCESLLREVIKPTLLWREIKESLAVFKEPTTFDGGFRLEALVSGDATESSFQTRGIENFHRSIRELRNALAHGKDARSSGVIIPTSRNYDKLAPWLSLISLAAGEVMVYRDVL
jgi:hypothetical protein